MVSESLSCAAWRSMVVCWPRTLGLLSYAGSTQSAPVVELFSCLLAPAALFLSSDWNLFFMAMHG